nr:pollen-specific leucine-rich repeat extensin-like protein 4 [Arachis hypogaea]
MGADAQGARTRQFKNRDNPSSRGILRSRATHPSQPPSSSPRPIYHRSSSTASAAAPPSPPATLTHPQPLFPSHPYPFSLSPSHPSQPRRDQPLRRRPVFTAGGALPPLCPLHSLLSFPSHHHPPSPQFLIPPAAPPRNPLCQLRSPLSSPPPLTAAQFLLLWPPAPIFLFHS